MDLQKRGVVGSSLNTAYLLERLLHRLLERLEPLMAIFVSNRLFTASNLIMVTGCFARAAAGNDIVFPRLWKQNSGLMARSVTQNAGDHGEHYITRDKKSIGHVYSAAGCINSH